MVAAVRDAGPLDILVVNAGVAIMGDPLTLDPDAVDRLFDINVRSPYHASVEAGRQMRDNGRIIIMGSINGDRAPAPGFTPYALSKSALQGLARGLARDFGRRGITVNVVQPGPVDTDMNPADGPFAEQLRRSMAIGRYAHADEVAALGHWSRLSEGLGDSCNLATGCSSRHSSRANSAAPQVTPMSATLNVQNRQVAVPTSMKSTTPRVCRRRSIRLPIAPAVSKPSANGTARVCAADCRSSTSRYTTMPIATMLKNGREKLPTERLIAAPVLYVSVHRSVWPNTSFGMCNVSADSAQRLVMMSATSTTPKLAANATLRGEVTGDEDGTGSGMRTRERE